VTSGTTNDEPRRRTNARLGVRTVVVAVLGALVLFGAGVGVGTQLAGDDSPQGGDTVAQEPTSAATQAPPNPATGKSRAEREAALAAGERPGPDTTGVLPGTELEQRGDVSVDEDGAVLEGLDISCLRINANNVTVRNSRVRCGADNGSVVIRQGVTNAVLEDVEIDGLGRAGNGIVHNNYTLRRVEIANASDGARAGSNVTIEHSYIHSLARMEGSHNDGVQTITGANVTLRGNTIDVVTGDEQDLMNAAYIISPNKTGGLVDNVIVEGNYLNGGNYTLYLGQGGAFPVTGLVVRDNEFGPQRRYGIVAGPPEGIVWEGNVDAEGNEVPVSGKVPDVQDPDAQGSD
jgi:hypothetical protein